MLLRYVSFFSMLCLLSACSNSSSSDSSATNILGEWKWNMTVGGIGGWTYTPLTEGYSCKIIFKNQSDCLVYLNDTLVRSGTYTLKSSNGVTQLSTPGAGDSVLFKLLRNIVVGGVITISNDSLTVSEEGINDGFSSLFIRK